MNHHFKDALHRMFHGWSTVVSYRDSLADRLHVHLTFADRAFEAHRYSKSELLDMLFSGTEASRLAKIAQQQGKRLGLRRYGRARKAGGR
jgi:hypothetical protein